MSPAAAALRAADPVAAAAEADDVDVLDPPSRTVRFCGREVQVEPMTIGKVPAVTRALRGVRLGDSSLPGVMELVAEHGDQVLQAAALATGLPLEEVQAASLDEFIELFGAIVEVNAAFFTRAAAHLVGTLQAFHGGGPTSSTSSSTPATGTPT